MAKKQFICLTCDKKFSEPDWFCYDDKRHTVEKKTYYSPSDGLQVMWKTERNYTTQEGAGSKNVFVPGKTAQFIKGVFRTDDPEEQLFMDSYGGCITPEHWDDIHITIEERERRQKTIMANQAQIIREQNDLLKQLQADTKAAAGK